jgi:hypothetical protein
MHLPVLQRYLVPLASLLVALSVLGASSRLLLVIALPALLIGVTFQRLPRPAAAAVALLLGVLSLGAGIIARIDLLIVAGLLYLLAGVTRGWGVNRGRSRVRAWTNRGLATVGAVLVAFLVVDPTMIVVDYLAKPRAPIDQAALALPHEQVMFTATDGAHLAGWYVLSHNGAAIVLVHGGGGDRQGTIRHARMLASAGYGVLLYDARGRGESGGHENAFAGSGTATCTAPSPTSPREASTESACSAYPPAPKQSSRKQHPTRAYKQSSQTGSKGGRPPTRAISRSVIASRSSSRLPSQAPRSSSRPDKRSRSRSWSSCTRSRGRDRCC